MGRCAGMSGRKTRNRALRGRAPGIGRATSGRDGAGLSLRRLSLYTGAMRDPRRNAVIGIATGYGFEELKPFFTSLRLSGFRGRALLLAGNLEPATKALLGRLGAEILAFSYPAENAPSLVVNGRFYLYRRLLADLAGEVDNILLTDIRDVVFQADPFDPDLGLAELEGRVCCFLEDPVTPIGKSALNADWIRRAYGLDILAELAGRPISCAGTVFGGREALLDYLRLLTRELDAIRPDFFGSDAAAHNLLVHRGLIPGLEVFDNDRGPVLTLALKAPETIRLDRRHRVVNDLGRVVPVLHQYDRHPLLNALLRSRFA